MDSIYRELKEYILDMGAFEVGFFNDDFKGYKNGISFYVKMSYDILKEIDDKPTYTYFHHYRTVNALIDRILIKRLQFSPGLDMLVKVVFL